MAIMKKTEQKDDAVSPVIGVMLMLVVTIIVAAVVATFAGGSVSSTEVPPTAVLDVNIYSAYNVGGTMSKTYAPEFTIDHLAGDPINTADIMLKFSWIDPNGERHFTQYDGSEESVSYNSGNGQGSLAKALYINDLVKYGSANLGKSAFGKVTMSPGDHMQTGANYLEQKHGPGPDYTYESSELMVHKYSPFMDAIFGETNVMDLLPSGTGVQVTIIHTPSEKAIYDKVVYVK